LIEMNGSRSEAVVLGMMTVSAPPRSYDLPDPQIPSEGARWQNGIRLLGYDLSDPAPDGTLTVTLYWQPEREIDAALTRFVHLIDAAGGILAQSDAIPAEGSRPTTGWLGGEVIADRARLTLPAGLPPGGWALRIGWYDPVTGIRTLLEGGEEFWLAGAK
jgi:hypothetical protein